MSDDQSTITADASVSLREVTGDTVRDIVHLQVAENQRHFVASNAVSIAEAYFEPKAWFRAIYADDTPVGFVMLYDDDSKPEYFLWRYMIDERYQGMGFGRRALEQLFEYVRTRPGATELLTSYVPDAGGAGPFYEKLGFVPTGKEEEGEVVMRLDLAKVS